MRGAEVDLPAGFSLATRDIPARLVSSPDAGRLPIGVVRAYEIATGRYLGGDLYGIVPPSTPTGVHLVS